MDNKTLLENLSNRLDISRETVATLIEGLSGVIGDCGASMESVTVASFGTFEPRKRLERVALHPASGRRLLVPPKVVLTFKPSSILKQRIKNG